MNNALGKITRPQVMIIGGVLALLIGIGFYFGLIKPLNEQYDAAKSKYDSQKVIADERPNAERAIVTNKAIVKKATDDYRIYERKFMSFTKNGQKYPVVDTSNLFRAMEQRWEEQTVRLGPLVKNFLEKDRTVRILQSNLAVPAPPSDPNAANTKVIELPLGSVTVSGTFENILKHVDRWNKFNRLVVVDGLSLQGNSPRLTGTYQLTCYIFPRADVAGPEVPQASAAGGGGFGGGGFSAGGGGVAPGGPPPGEADGPGAGGGAAGVDF